MKLMQFFLILATFVAAGADVTAGAGAEFPVTPPAIIWGVELPKPSSIFGYVDKESLVGMLQPLEQTPHMIIAFFANDLTSKDFSCLDNDCFPFLRTVKPFNYYSQVYQLLAALETIATMRNQTVIWDNFTFPFEPSCLPNEIHVYNFTDQQLNSHDNSMKIISEALNDCPVIQIYTAHGEEMEAYQRRRDRIEHKEIRQELSRAGQNTSQSRPAPKPIVLRNMLAVVSITKVVLAEEVKKGFHTSYKRTDVIIREGRDSLLKLSMVDKSSILNGFSVEINTTMGPLAVDVLPISGNWHIWRLRFNKHIFKPRDLWFFSRKFSFCCAEMVVYSEHGSTLTITMFHIDVESKRADFSPLDLDYKAKKCWLCEQFFTPGLTQALFTICLLLLILGIGLSMLLTIGRPLRFPSVNEPELYVKGYAEH